jgi:putative ABC transport system permease protein
MALTNAAAIIDGAGAKSAHAVQGRCRSPSTCLSHWPMRFQLVKTRLTDTAWRIGLARPKFNAFLLSIFAIAALLLSAIGLYAVMAAYVRQRDREIALRLALGATATAVRRFVLAEALWLAGLGAVIGLTAAASATRFLRGMLFEVHPLDPWTMLGAALLLIAAAALASFVPVRRATRVDAMAMLRSE